MKNLLKKYSALSVISFSLLTLIACGNGDSHAGEDLHADEIKTHSDAVQLTDSEMAEFGIELAQAGPGEVKIHVSLPGEIIIPPDNLAHIHPRFAGIVKQVFKHIGDQVKRGETLAIIEGNESLSEYAVKSLIDGRIIEKHLSLGEVVDDAQHGFLIADISTVWAQLSLYQKDLPFVKEGQKVNISAGAYLPELNSRIEYISPIIDETTRTTTARVVISNPKGVWKPGLFISGEIATHSKRAAIAIPKTALQHYEGNTVVFVRDDHGFKPRVISLGLSNAVSVEVVHGLNVGETYVSKGGFTLKAELQKGEMGDSHAH